MKGFVRRLALTGVIVALAGPAVWAASATTTASTASAPTRVAGVSTATKAAAARAEALRELKTITAKGRPGPGMPAPGGRVHSANGLSAVSYYNWAGYADDNTSGNTYTKVTGTWTQPKLTCGNEGAIALFWIGFDGFSNNTVEQDGTYAQCFEGTAYYFTWWEMYPTNSIQIVGTMLPGDAIHAVVQFTGGKFKLTVTDSTTTAASFTTTQSCGSGLTCARKSAEWIAERPGEVTGLYPLGHFAPWSISGATATSGATTGAISAFPDDVIQMIDTTDSYDLATTGALNATGKGFTSTWKVQY